MHRSMGERLLVRVVMVAADYVVLQLQDAQHRSEEVSDLSDYHGCIPTSLIGTSVPRIEHTSRTTWYIFGRAWGFSWSIDAANLRNRSRIVQLIQQTYL